jgi:hypothetical protein
MQYPPRFLFVSYFLFDLPKVGWPLGSMLYELNSLPFELSSAVTTSGCSASSIPPASTHTHEDTVPTNDSAANMTHVVATPYNNDVVSALMIGVYKYPLKICLV